MTITYRTTGPWGAGKGSNLAPAEVDGNFYDIDQRVQYVEDNPPLPIEPISITIAGYNFSMGLSNGETLGPVIMTMPVPEWRGEWTPNTQYNDMDFITAPDGGFGAVMQAHTSAATFDWAALGSNGLPNYRQIVGSNAMTVALSDLTDVALSGLASNDMLAWDAAASYWRNRHPAEVAANLPAFTGDTGTGGAKGLVPPPLSGDAAANKYLSASGTWTVPATGSGGSSSLAGLTDVAINDPVNDSLIQYKAGDGKWHNASLVELGAGTVTSVTAGTGLSGGTITAAGTIALAAAPASTLLANTTAGSAAPAPASLTVALDALAGATRGSLLQRDAIGWQPLAPGTAGLFLRTGGSGADLTWASPAGNGTVTSVTAGAGLSGGTITTAGTIALAAIGDDRLLANISGGSAPPTETSVTALLDAALGTTRGSIIRRDGSAWTALGPGTAGHVLTSGGTGADVTWAPGGGGGASVSIGDAPPASPDPGDMWWSSADGNLYIRYQDPDSTAWVSAVNQPGPQGPAGQPWTVGTGLTLDTAVEPDRLSLVIPVAIASGGTGAQTPADARTALGAAPLDSPAFTGTPSLPTGTTAVTQAAATNDTSVATTSFVKAQAYVTGGPYLPTAGGTVTGALTVTGNFTVSASAGDPVQFTVPSGQWCRQRYTITGSRTWAAGVLAPSLSYTISDETAGVTRLAIDTAGGCSASSTWAVISDERLKTDVQPYTRGLADLLPLEPIMYKWTGTGGTSADGELHYGLSAQQVEAVMPELIREQEYVPQEDAKDDEPMTLKTYSPTDITFALINAIKELNARIAALEAQLAGSRV